jgi:hypothetical protein
MTLLAIPILAYSQSYTPFPESGVIWTQDHAGVSCYNPLNLCSTYQYTYQGDTVISGKSYRTLYKSGYYFDENLIPSYFIEYSGALRQEIENKTVYFVERETDQEQLLYDFNLNQGDTIPVAYNNQYVIAIVASIDSVIVGSQYRKRFILENTATGASELIEGIGSNAGLLEPLFQFEENYILRCYNLSDSIYYPELNNSCELITAVQDLINDQNIMEIIPNPLSTKSIIKIGGMIHPETYIEISNISGQIVKRIYQHSSSELELNRDEFIPGIYVCVLRSRDDSQVGIKKFVVR